jgi:pyruvate oxidase
MISRASRPMIIVGAGARFDMDPILELAERLGSAVATTFKAKGLVSDHHPLSCGVLGR